MAVVYHAVPNFRIRARIYSRTDRRRADKKVDVITNPQTTAYYAGYGDPLRSEGPLRRAVPDRRSSRLGNEGNGGEFQITKAFNSCKGAIWDINVMFAHRSDEVNLKKAYVGVTNVLESNPNAKSEPVP